MNLYLYYTLNITIQNLIINPRWMLLPNKNKNIFANKSYNQVMMQINSLTSSAKT